MFSVFGCSLVVVCCPLFVVFVACCLLFVAFVCCVLVAGVFAAAAAASAVGVVVPVAKALQSSLAPRARQPNRKRALKCARLNHTLAK